MRNWLVRILIIVMVVVAVAGAVVACTQKGSTPDDSLTASSFLV